MQRYENNHAFKLKDSADFANLTVLWNRDGVQAIGGRLRSQEKGESDIQMLMFDSRKFNFDGAAAWCKEHNYITMDSSESMQDEAVNPGIKFEKMSFRFEGSDTTPVEGHSYSKQVAKLGKWDGKKFDAEYANHLITEFGKMQKAGLKIPLYLGHPVSTEDRLNNATGWVNKLELDGDYLTAELEVTDPKIEEKIASYDTSISTDIFKDGKGKVWELVLDHVALTPTPAISGLGGFEKIAASLLDGEIVFKKEIPVIPNKEDNMNFEKITASLGTAVTAENYEQLTLDLIKERNELKEKYAALELANKPKEVTDQTLSFARKAYQGEVDALVKSGKIQPALAKKIVDAYLGETLKLSLSREEKNPYSGSLVSIDNLLSILSEVEPISFDAKSAIVVAPEAGKPKENPVIAAQADPAFQAKLARLNGKQ
jgi:hypothetical protein